MRKVIRAYNEAVFETNREAPFEAGGRNRNIPLGFFGGIPPSCCRAIAEHA